MIISTVIGFMTEACAPSGGRNKSASTPLKALSRSPILLFILPETDWPCPPGPTSRYFQAHKSHKLKKPRLASDQNGEIHQIQIFIRELAKPRLMRRARYLNPIQMDHLCLIQKDLKPITAAIVRGTTKSLISSDITLLSCVTHEAIIQLVIE